MALGGELRSNRKGCALIAAVLLVVPLLAVGVVGVRTWTPLQRAGDSLKALEQELGEAAIYVPHPAGAIEAARIETFLDLRESLLPLCADYGGVQAAFDAVEGLEDEQQPNREEVTGVAQALGGAALEITPYLARYFEARNAALLAARMGLQEYAYIFALAYHDQLLSPATQAEIFSDDEALSRAAAEMLRSCLARQRSQDEMSTVDAHDISMEMAAMEADPGRLIWQDGLPAATRASLDAYRERLDLLFCPATAGLEMERGAQRAIWTALE